MTDAPLHLLPPTSTALERAVSETSARLLTLPTEVVRQIRDPWTCPTALLPYLALERRVRQWDPDWTEDVKRAVIAAAYPVHQLAGTRGAMERAFAALNVQITLLEWFQYGGSPYTFRAKWGLAPGEGLNLEQARKLMKLARQTKNARSRMDRLEVSASGPEAVAYVGCAVRTRTRYRAAA